MRLKQKSRWTDQRNNKDVQQWWAEDFFWKQKPMRSKEKSNLRLSTYIYWIFHQRSKPSDPNSAFSMPPKQENDWHHVWWLFSKENGPKLAKPCQIVCVSSGNCQKSAQITQRRWNRSIWNVKLWLLKEISPEGILWSKHQGSSRCQRQGSVSSKKFG